MIRPFIIFFLPLLTFFGFAPKRGLPTVKEVDLEKYAGTWYEIARLPNSFERGLSSVTATYNLKNNGKIQVINRGYKDSTRKWKEIKGRARQPDASYPGRLKVTFFWPFAGDYYIIELDQDYKYALVGAPSSDFLWILAREPKLEKDTYKSLIEKARKLGFPVDQMEMVDQGKNLD